MGVAATRDCGMAVATGAAVGAITGVVRLRGGANVTTGVGIGATTGVGTACGGMTGVGRGGVARGLGTRGALILAGACTLADATGGRAVGATVGAGAS